MTVVGAFVITSGLCGLAWSAGVLIGFRVLQGLAGGMIMPVGMITLAQAAGPQRMGRTMSVVGVPMLLAPVLGPVLGGLLVDNLSWRWIFYVNVPIGAVGLVLAARLLPSERAAGRGSAAGETEVPLDWRGLVLASPGVAFVVFGLSEYGTHGTIATPSAWLPMALGAGMVTAFVRHALRARFPLVDVQLFRGTGFSAAAATVFLTGIALFGSMILLPLYYQEVRGLSAVQAGMLLAPQGVGAAIGMNVGGRLADTRGAGRVVLTGLVVLTAGTFFFTQVGAATPYWVLCVGLLLRGLGLGATMMPSMAAAYATLQREQVPRATPMLNVLQRVGGSMGAAVLTVILANTAADRVAEGRTGAASAFAHTYWWALALTAIAFVPAAVLAREEARVRRQTRRDTAAVATKPTTATTAIG
jgi:EmrB/QacA subfamily drug resistance transporter